MALIANRDCEFVASAHAIVRAKSRLSDEFFRDRLDTWELIDDWLCRIAHEAVVSLGDSPIPHGSLLSVRGARVALERSGNTIVIVTCMNRKCWHPREMEIVGDG